MEVEEEFISDMPDDKEEQKYKDKFELKILPNEVINLKLLVKDDFVQAWVSFTKPVDVNGRMTDYVWFGSESDVINVKGPAQGVVYWC